MNHIYNESDFEGFDKRFRTNFFNSLIGMRSLQLVGTQNKQGNTNLAPFSSVFHMGSNPAYFGMLFRPSDEVPRHTLANILETNFYTFNHVNIDFYKQAHQASAKYASDFSEFDACGFGLEYLPGFLAPFAIEAKIKLGLAFVEQHEMKFNKTTLVIGKVVTACLSNDYIGDDGFVDVLKAGSVAGLGIDGYAFADRFSRLPYARVDENTKSILP